MHPRHWVNYVANDLIATMIYRKCKRKLPFPTYIEEEFPEDEEEDEAHSVCSESVLGVVAGPSQTSTHAYAYLHISIRQSGGHAVV